jgi:hypothetical protein
MKELEIKDKKKTEISVEKQQQIEYELIGQLRPKSGHKVWEIDIETLEVKEAEYHKDTVLILDVLNPVVPNKKLIINEGKNYVCALKKETALKKHKEGKNGSRENLGYKF